jgi:hypothetical protein
LAEANRPSRRHSISREKFNAKAQRGGPQPNFHHEGHEEHEEKSYNLSYSILRVLRDLRGEKVLSDMSEFGILHCEDPTRMGFAALSRIHAVVEKDRKILRQV